MISAGLERNFYFASFGEIIRAVTSCGAWWHLDVKATFHYGNCIDRHRSLV